MSFQKEHLHLLEESDYYVCEKSDGVRYLLYFTQPPSGPCAFLIDRAYKIYELRGVFLPDRKNLDEIIKDTVLDGELVTDHTGNFTYYIFDCLLYNSAKVWHLKLPQRLRFVQNEIIKVFEDVEQKHSRYPFKLLLKEMHKPYGIQAVFEKIELQNHDNDGLIFTPVNEPLVSGTMPTL